MLFSSSLHNKRGLSQTHSSFRLSFYEQQVNKHLSRYKKKKIFLMRLSLQRKRMYYVSAYLSPSFWFVLTVFQGIYRNWLKRDARNDVQK